MGKFKFIETGIEGLTIVEPTVFGDDRGYFMETYSKREFADAGLPTCFVQDNQSKSRQGVLRGLHFQIKHPQGKLVRALSGAVLDVAVDIRKNSPTFGQWRSCLLTEENKRQFYVPEGFAHGFSVLSQEAVFAYKCTALYDPTDEGDIMYNDPQLNIDWQIPEGVGGAPFRKGQKSSRAGCPGGNRLRDTIKVFKRYRYLLGNLISRDLKVKYRRSVLGVVWSVLNPLLTMVVIATVFAHLFRFQIENYHLYFLVGNVLWTFFSEATNGAMGSVLENSQLLKKVYIPKYMFPLEKCLFACVNLLFSMVAVLIVMAFSGVWPTVTFFLFPFVVLLCLVFAIGMGLLLSSLTVFFRDIMHLYGVVLTAWMYATPIIYPLDLANLPGIIVAVMQFNPMYYFVTMRAMCCCTIPCLPFRCGCALRRLRSGFCCWGCGALRKSRIALCCMCKRRKERWNNRSSWMCSM